MSYIDGQPKVEHVDISDDEHRSAVYFAVKGEKFYFTICIETVSPYSICGAYTTPYCNIGLKASSETITSEELEKYTQLIPTNKYNKGDSMLPRRILRRYSAIFFEPHPEPDEFEYKLANTLSFLEQDKDGIKQLIKNVDCMLVVAMYIHNGNGSIEGLHITKDLLKRLADLDIDIDIDLYAAGNLFLS